MGDTGMAKFDLNDATVIVTGGSRGIGPHIAAAFAGRGARVGLVARTGPELEAVAHGLTSHGCRVLPVAADVTSGDDRRRLVDTVVRELGPVDVLVNNAGGDPQREFHLLSEDDIHDIISLNLTSAVVLSRLVLPGMLERARGHIVNVSSMAGRTSFPFTEAYAAGKDGLIGFSRVVRGDYRGRGVSASTLILGPVRDAGVGARTAEEFGLKVPRAASVSPEQVGRAAVRAVVKDKAEIAVLPGPGRTLRALMDRFPGVGPAMNRATGAEKTMRAVVDRRQDEARGAIDARRAS
jgi:short-subunit dehydrogenase